MQAPRIASSLVLAIGLRRTIVGAARNNNIAPPFDYSFATISQHLRFDVRNSDPHTSVGSQSDVGPAYVLCTSGASCDTQSNLAVHTSVVVATDRGNDRRRCGQLCCFNAF